MELRRDHHSAPSTAPAVRPKRRPSTAADGPRVKRRRALLSTVSSASPTASTTDVERRSAGSARQRTAVPLRAVSPAQARFDAEKSAFQKTSRHQNTLRGDNQQPQSLFGRRADPSVQSPLSRSRALVHADASVAAARHTARPASRAPCPPLTQCDTTSDERRPSGSKMLFIKSKGDVDNREDCRASVAHATTPEMVEGDDILHTLLSVSTPRVTRRFPSEDALTGRERRDRQVLRQRRQRLQREYSFVKEDKETALGGCRTRDAHLGGTLLPSQEGSGRRKRSVTPSAWVQETRELSKRQNMDHDIVDGGGNGVVGRRLHLVGEEVETDEESTESKIERLSKVMPMNWRHFFVWLVSGAVLLCAMVVAVPFVKSVLKAPLPYCDSEWSEVDDGTFVLADPADAFDRSKALQPFTSTAAMKTHGSEPMCQPCPVYGNCLNGSIISCATPYELQHGLCKENSEVQASLNRLAFYIRKVIVDKAAKSACDNVSFWTFLHSDSSAPKPARDVTAPVKVLLSDVQALVAQSSSFEKTVPDLSRDYVFNRALDMALRDLEDVSATEDQTQLMVGKRVVPWACRAKRQLYEHTVLILLAVALGAALVSGYRQFLLYRTRRQLVDRFVREVRFLLLDRTRHADQCYPVESLRDHLFGKQSLQDRAWLCKSVWPKVVAAVKKDPRISARAMRVQDKDVTVWEWASSPSRTHRRAGSHQGRRSRMSRPHQGSIGSSGLAPLGQRKKKSRMSLP
ncbi:unnamed protein product [Hyaloperonospora brassicae]|uniref:Man1/Src1-like C-terminal domain-containing protein n=1 Tax=Hyaloperonospora brassicae TaxID=162125 RepID=A0AAV0UX23_HYABA|nr:unnamed protein product [Hyaloperonospora brassicae]